MVREYQLGKWCSACWTRCIQQDGGTDMCDLRLLGANILLAYWHYCNKGEATLPD
jgi:hypothetical protein